ncbi:MAG: anaerobic ribonucleoside-triphosphate reductase activating protein [Candidatus Hodarchaeota archaeon]
MRIGGFIDISTKDIPERTSMVIFTVGCNLKCEFCHNKYLLNPNVGKDMEVSEIIERVKSNLLVSGVSITGGEPTLQKDLIDLCKEIQKIGKYINIDTNGTNPVLISKLLPYISRVSLDLKGPLKKSKLEKITHSNIYPEYIIATFHIINDRDNIDFEIRTTYVEKLMKTEDIHKIITFLKKNKFRGTFVLQQYQYSDGVGEKYKEIYHMPEHVTLLQIIRKYRKKDLPFDVFIRDNVVGYKNINEIEDFWN